MAGSNTADAPFPFAGGAHFINGSYRGPRTERAHILRYRKCFIFLFSFYGILPHWRLHFLPVLTGRKRSKGRNSRPRFQPKIPPRRLPPRNSLPAVAQTGAPASRRPMKILPCGPVSNGMVGELYQRFPALRRRSRTHIQWHIVFLHDAGRHWDTPLPEVNDAGTALRCSFRPCRCRRHCDISRCAQAVQAHIRCCRESCIFSFRRGNPGSVPFWHVMPWSLHFAARKRKSAKKRGRRPGENPCRRAPTPSPPTLTLSVPIHFDSPIKEIPCLRTLPIHLPTSAPPGHNGKHARMAPKEPTRLSSNAHIPISPVWLRRV